MRLRLGFFTNASSRGCRVLCRCYHPLPSFFPRTHTHAHTEAHSPRLARIHCSQIAPATTRAAHQVTHTPDSHTQVKTLTFSAPPIPPPTPAPRSRVSALSSDTGSQRERPPSASSTPPRDAPLRHTTSPQPPRKANYYFTLFFCCCFYPSRLVRASREPADGILLSKHYTARALPTCCRRN